MKSIQSTTLIQLAASAQQTLTGDWVLLGGALLHYFGHDTRVTTDIDLVPLGTHVGNQPLLESFALAERLELPVEAINGAALFFLEKIPHYVKELVELEKWPSGRLLRPSLFLFWRLKLARLTESDAHDCRESLRLRWPEDTAQERERIAAVIAQALAEKNLGSGKKKILTELKRSLRP